MKKMELKIAFTFAIVLSLGIIINGMYDLIRGRRFFSFNALSTGLILAIIYLGFIWINTRRYKLLTLIGIISIGIIVSYMIFSIDGITGIVNSWTAKETIMFVFCAIFYFVAANQAEQLEKQ